MRMETFIRKSLGLKAHMVTQVEEREAGGELVVQIDRLGQRRLRCGACGQEATRVALTRRPARRWRDLAMRAHLVELVYAPHRVWCSHCGLRVERIPWADKWQRVTHTLFRAVATLARQLDWASVAAHFHLNWKTVAAVVEGAVLWGLQHRPWKPLHRLGLDEVSRRKGQQLPDGCLRPRTGPGGVGGPGPYRGDDDTLLRLAGPPPHPGYSDRLL